MEKMNVRELRKNLRAVLDANEETEIGDGYHLRAIVIPVSRNHDWYPEFSKDLRAAVKRAKEVVQRLQTLAKDSRF